MVKKTLLILPALVVLGGIGVAFAHSSSNNPTEKGNFLQDMLSHYKEMHNDPEAGINDMLEHHREMHGSDFSIGDMAQMHKLMHGEDSEFTGCPMHS